MNQNWLINIKVKHHNHPISEVAANTTSHERSVWNQLPVVTSQIIPNLVYPTLLPLDWLTAARARE
jgi:hypothetical protein